MMLMPIVSASSRYSARAALQVVGHVPSFHGIGWGPEDVSLAVGTVAALQEALSDPLV
jgi:hypothetical protein